MIHLRRSKDGGYYLNIIARNGREIWRTSETYTRKESALKALAAIHRILVEHPMKHGVFLYKDHTA